MSPSSNNDDKTIIYCKDVAKKLGIKGHTCRRKYFLDKKNRQRHKLRTFCIKATSPERPYIHKFFFHIASNDWLIINHTNQSTNQTSTGR